jgi:hypothetical protein
MADMMSPLMTHIIDVDTIKPDWEMKKNIVRANENVEFDVQVSISGAQNWSWFVEEQQTDLNAPRTPFIRREDWTAAYRRQIKPDEIEKRFKGLITS